eukprot:763568-Hanusia_phi.AAC.1
MAINKPNKDRFLALPCVCSTLHIATPQSRVPHPPVERRSKKKKKRMDPHPLENYSRVHTIGGSPYIDHFSGEPRTRSVPALGYFALRPVVD